MSPAPAPAVLAFGLLAALLAAALVAVVIAWRRARHELVRLRAGRMKIPPLPVEDSERLILALDAARDGVWDLDLTTGQLKGSAAFGGVVRPDSAPPRNNDEWLALVHPDDRPRLERARSGRDADGEAGYACEARMLRPDGGVIWVLEHGRVTRRDEQGRPVRMTGTIRDITARRRAEQHLEMRGRLAAACLAARGDQLRSELGALLRETLDSVGACVGMYDDGGRLRVACADANDAAGLPAAVLAPDEVPDLLRRLIDSEGPRILEGTADTVAGLPSPVLGTRLVSGTRVLGLVAVGGRASGYRPEDIETLTGIAADLAPLVQARLEAEVAEDRRAQGQKMEALGVMAGGIAHDFNNILQAILGFSTLARQDAHDPARLAADLDRVQRATVRGRDLVQRILQFSRPGDGSAPLLDPLPLVEDVAIELRSLLPPSIGIGTDLAAGCGRVRAPAAELRQALMNLATNAAQAMADGGGSLKLSARPWRIPADDGGFPADWHGRDVVELAVTDTGPGIPEEHRARLFDPFFTTRDVGQGTGLGLSIVHGLVTGLGGNVRIACPVSGGTVVSIYLPRLDSATSVAGAAPAVEPRVPSASNGGRVLFVDDDPEIRELAVALLGRAGFAVEVAPDGRSAAERLDAAPDDFDVVVTDQYMPGMTGRELALRLAARRPGLPVILVTGLDEPSAPTLAGGQVVREVVTKPFFGQSLCLAVRRALAAPRSGA